LARLQAINFTAVPGAVRPFECIRNRHKPSPFCLLTDSMRYSVLGSYQSFPFND
jgi:hypothetical protein